MENNQNNQMAEANLRDVIGILFKHRAKILISFSLVMFVAIMIIILSPKVYESEAKLLVNLGRKSMTMDSASDFQERIHVSQSMENQMNSQIEILKSPDLMQKVVETLGVESFGDDSTTYKSDKDSIPGKLRRALKDMLAFPRNAIADFVETSEKGQGEGNDKTEIIANRIRAGLKVSAVQESNIIQISFEAQNPYLARDVIHELIKAYFDKYRELIDSPKSHEFFKKESADFEQQLEAAENRLKEFKNKINVGSFADHRQILSQQIGNLQQQLKTARSEVARLNSLEDAIRKQPETASDLFVPQESIGQPSRAMSDMSNRIYELQLREQELLSVYKEDSVPVQEVRRQIDEAQKLFIRAKRSALDAARAQAVSNVSSLENQLASANKELKKLNEAEYKLAQLEREKQLLEKKYQTYAYNLEQTRIDKALEMEEISNIKIAQAPIMPIEPVGPRKKITLILGFMVAFLSSFGLAFFTEYFDNSLQKPEQIEELLNIPVLGSVEKMKK